MDTEGLFRYLAGTGVALRAGAAGANAAADALFGPFHAAARKLSPMAGLPVDETRAMLCVFAMFPLGFLLNILPRGYTRRAVDGMVGLAMVIFCCGAVPTLLPLCTAALVWFGLVAQARQRTLLCVIAAPLGTYFAYIQYTNYLRFRFDILYPQMILTMKLWMLVCNVEDGKRLPSLSNMRKRYSLAHVPPLFHVLGYSFSGMGTLAGPAIEYRVYDVFCSSDPGASVVDSEKSEPRRPAVDLRRAAMCLAWAVLEAALLQLKPQYQSNFVLHRFFGYLPLYLRVGFVWLCIFVLRARYFLLWKLTDAACMLTGVGMAGLSDPYYDIRGGEPWAFETAQSIKVATEMWNCRAAHWLRYYVYDRISISSLKLFGTYAVSATWHGFYPGYYIMFLLIGIYQNIAREVRRRIRPRVVGSKSAKLVYDAITLVATSLSLSYAAVFYDLLAWDRAVLFARSLPHGIVAAVVLSALVRVIPRPRQSVPDTKKVA